MDTGDEFLLFLEFGFDFAADLPFDLGRGILLAKTPHAFLAFLRLHEVLRFCILGMIDLGSAESKSILSGSGPKLQSKLDALENPNGHFAQTAMKSLVGIDITWQGVG